MAYEVSTPVFEGPFDLLLHLVTVEQVDLYEVSIARIVDAYLAEMARMEDELDLEVTTEFVLIAAILIELKCRRLLPGPDDVDADEEVALWEERDLLLSRLLECKTFKDAGAALGRLADAAAASPPRMADLEDRLTKLAPDLLAHITADRLGLAMARLAAPRPEPRVDVSHLAPISLSVADTVVRLSEMLPVRGPVRFGDLTATLVGRLEVIVYFLAILELYKDGLVELEQAERFGALLVAWVGEEVPVSASALASAGLSREA
ncbi:MAG: segregation/condensation protein A [Acidimicrobiales bacterium]|nr:MAG: segregation/condensation protein A [Acidimicrobiales bacterium]